MIKKKIKNNNGITLVALVVTIVVLLILAGTSINLVIGNSGIVEKSKKASEETRASKVEEEREFWVEEKEIDEYAETGKNGRTLNQVLDKLESSNSITKHEKVEIEQKGYVKIASKNINFCEGINKRQHIVKNSNEEIVFKNVIKEGDILKEKEDYKNYTILGVSNEKTGTYIKEGKVIGKSGYLEIVGDIKDANFKYNLTDFMKGDEIFYIQVNIDDQPKYLELKVIQGKEVVYEENFAGIKYNANGINSVEWILDKNENYSNKQAMKGKNNLSGKIDVVKISFYGSGIDIVTVATPESAKMGIKMLNKENKVIASYLKIFDSANQENEYNAKLSEISTKYINRPEDFYRLEIAVLGGTYSYLDQIIVYR